MQFVFTDEQMQFREIVARFMHDKSPPTEVRRLMETEKGYDPAVWSQLSQELGLTAVHIPEQYGGQGFSFIELAIVMEEAGRALLCAPYLSSCVMAAGALLHLGSEAQKLRWLPAIAAGSTLGALAISEPDGSWLPGAARLAVADADGTPRLNGQKTLVVDGMTADLLVVVAAEPHAGATRPACYLVAGDAPGLSRRALDALDPTRKLAALEFDDVPAERLGEGDATAGLDRTLDEIAVALANELVGAAQHLFASTLEYTRLRMQFGRAIGSFQAIKHRCADMLIDVELAKSAAWYAADAAAREDPEFPALASLAKASAGESCMQTAATAIQLHGGIGFTFDHDTHLWYKRAKAGEVLLGDPAFHRDQMMQRWSLQ